MFYTFVSMFYISNANFSRWYAVRNDSCVWRRIHRFQLLLRCMLIDLAFLDVLLDFPDCYLKLWWLLFLSRWRKLDYKGRNIGTYTPQLRVLNLLPCQFHLVIEKDFSTGLLLVQKSLGNWSWFGLCFVGFDKIYFYYLYYHYLYLDFR